MATTPVFSSRPIVIATLFVMLLLTSGTYAGPATRPTTAPVSFTIHGIDDPSGPGALNLETLQALIMPGELREWDQRRIGWLKENAADVIFDHERSAFFILGWGTTLAPVNNFVWMEDLNWIDATLAEPPGQASDWLHLQFRDTVVLPMTFAYRTWHGTTGLLRVSELQQSPWRLKVEVRAVAPTTAPARH